jgi:hypothetical protein
MGSSFLLKARAAWLFGAGLAVCGLLLLLYFAALLYWHFGVAKASVVPANLHLGIVFAVAGAALTALGLHVARGQAARISAEKSRRADRLRRVHEYRYASRVEPYLGNATDAGAEESTGPAAPRSRHLRRR